MSKEVWFVTGSSRGLGRAIVETALAQDKCVVATARNTASLKSLENDYEAQLLRLSLDVTDPDRATGAVDEAIARFGRLDVVVNNAGYADIAPIEEVSLADFTAQVDAVFFGTVHVTRAAIPVFRRQRSGMFIQVASVGGRITAPGLGAYQSAKFAVEGFSSVLRQELGPFGIRVMVAEPGSMRTDWAGDSMKVVEYDRAYDSTVGETARRIRESSGQQPIDPYAVADALLALADDPAPPLHLLLGSDAVEIGKRSLEDTGVVDAQWAEVGRSVDYGIRR